MSGVCGPYFQSLEGQITPTLEPGGRLVCRDGELTLEQMYKPEVICDATEQWPDEYEGCDNGIKVTPDCLPYAPPHPCVECLCEKITPTGTTAWNGNVTLPVNNTPYPMNWFLGISRSVDLTSGPQPSPLFEAIYAWDTWNGKRVECSFQKRSTANTTFRWCAHSSYFICESVPPGESLTCTIGTDTIGAVGGDHCWWINGMGIAAPSCRGC